MRLRRWRTDTDPSHTMEEEMLAGEELQVAIDALEVAVAEAKRLFAGEPPPDLGKP